VYFVASQIGWPLGLFLGMPLIWGKWPTSIRLSRAAWIVVIAAGTIGTLAGIAIVAFDKMKNKLRISIEQLKESEFAEKELGLARELQSRMLPPAEISADGYRVTSRNFAARYVAGDFYDVFQHADGAVGIAIADVAGKGLAASLIMASVKSVLPLLAMSRTVGEALQALNEKLVGELSKREFVALALAKYEPSTGRVSIANAGLPDPYVFRNGTIEALPVGGTRLPLGLRRGLTYDQVEIELNHGDSVLFLSDGLPEASMPNGEPLGYDALATIIESAGPDIDRILERVNAVATRDDDQTIVLLQRR
jgi:sigma-B regulation protein RsbU (phosphoserine phosphatase)